MIAKVIYLRRDDSRDLEGRWGADRRNQLNQIVTQFRIAESVITKARELASGAGEVNEP